MSTKSNNEKPTKYSDKKKKLSDDEFILLNEKFKDPETLQTHLENQGVHLPSFIYFDSQMMNRMLKGEQKYCMKTECPNCIMQYSPKVQGTSVVAMLEKIKGDPEASKYIDTSRRKYNRMFLVGILTVCFPEHVEDLRDQLAEKWKSKKPKEQRISEVNEQLFNLMNSRKAEDKGDKKYFTKQSLKAGTVVKRKRKDD